MKILATDRLVLRRFTPDDAPFIFKLMNEPGWLRFIGDRGINSVEAARSYIDTRLIASYKQHGFGLYAVQLKDRQTLIGMCGLVKRDGLEDVDIGFALLAGYEGRGYAIEAARATLKYAHEVHTLHRIVAITSENNERSIRLLEGIGMVYEKTVRLPGDDSAVKLYAAGLPEPGGERT